jgi:hypothetical protein
LFFAYIAHCKEHRPLHYLAQAGEAAVAAFDILRSGLPDISVTLLIFGFVKTEADGFIAVFVIEHGVHPIL